MKLLFKRVYPVIVIALFVSVTATAKTPKPPKYPSLFWEITGNGLQKPSYLFGTMHVSNKMVFHLSDSFYHAMQNCDEVALELNPEYWQKDMMKMESGQMAIGQYLRNGANDYLNEKSFRLEKYEDDLKAALTEEPSQINGLLYRTFQTQADFEENTYLDLYIYQTGRKMGKRAGGVEDYYESQKMLFEAYQDMAKEKNKKKPDTDGESPYEIQKKIQEAYRRGDLDMLDSLEKFSFNSQAFMEKFLYRRNEIQANSIDTIVQKNALFVGVGAAHLAGKRGVIELLRKKGYLLRPVFMQDRDADKKDTIDKLKVPVNFRPTNTDDGFVQLQLPGKFYKRNDTKKNGNDSWQYADMDNGTYYMLTRVQTHAAMWGQSTADVQKKIDSLLYENIPGKIIKKTKITKNGYPGFDISNKTRRGDIQRYNIIITPFEVLVFKMSGNDNYVDGKEADSFFNSISVKNYPQQPTVFNTHNGGFRASFPQTPNEVLNKNTGDRLNRWEYEAADSATGNAYLIWKKTIQNYRFIEEDSFDLGLMEESIKQSELVDKQVNRSFGKQNGYASLNMQFALKNGSTLFAKAVLRGPHYYLLAVSSRQKKYNPAAFFDSFNLTDFEYPAPVTFTDTTLHFQVKTPVQPALDASLMSLVNQATNEDFLNRTQDYIPYWPKEKNAYFESDSTGEAVLVNITKYPKYFYRKDSAKFWADEIADKEFADMIVAKKERLKLYDSCEGYKIILRDTNTVRQVTNYFILKDDRLFHITALGDTLGKETSFVQSFLSSFRPEEKKLGPNVFEKKLDRFFSDFHSADTLTKKRVKDAISNIYFSCTGFEKIKQTIDGLKFGDKDYFDLKSKFISRLGYMDDSDCVVNVEKYLIDLYAKTADTSYFQNEIIQSLARLKTKTAYAALKNLLLQDPPVFDNSYDYNTIFNSMEDTLALSKNLFPDLLQLASLNDYKQPVDGLLRMMVDSGFLTAKDYDQYYSRIYFDAKLELKKQQNRDEKTLEKESRQDEDDNNDAGNNMMGQDYGRTNNNTDIEDYPGLLMPFYDKYPAVPKYFDRLLLSKDLLVQLDAAALLAQNKRAVPDTIWYNLAGKDQYRAKLLAKLEKIKRTDLFPEAFKKQDLLARALLLNDKGLEKFYAIKLISKQPVNINTQNGYVYFYEYKSKKEDEWKMGISGIQPLNSKEVSSNNDLTHMTDRKIKEDEPVEEQFNKQLKKLLFAKHKSARMFFNDNDYDYLNRNYNSEGN